MQFCANNLKTIAFSKIFIGSKSVQHDEIYLCAYFEENSLTGIRVIALFMRFWCIWCLKFQKSSPLKLLNRIWWNLVKSILDMSTTKVMSDMAANQITSLPLLKINHRGPLKPGERLRLSWASSYFLVYNIFLIVKLWNVYKIIPRVPNMTPKVW